VDDVECGSMIFHFHPQNLRTADDHLVLGKAKQVPSFLVKGQARRGVASHSLVAARFLSH
jgi:hypothetical protein